jgi:hypothetical protein
VWSWSPKVLGDIRASDGALLLELTPEIQLMIGSGRGMTDANRYVAIVQPETGGEIRLKLRPVAKD